MRLDWCTHAAAKWAVEHWHYSHLMPKGRLARLGVWEDEQFVGCILFGGSANATLGTRYGLTQFQVCELVRIALTRHAHAVTEMLAIAIRLIKKAYPKLRLIVSFADPEHGHVGAIYQAGNWIYTGMTQPSPEYIFKGQRRHGRGMRMTLQAYELGSGNTLTRAQQLDPKARVVAGSSKHRYLFPLDKPLQRLILREKLPYPKPAGLVQLVESALPAQDGGSRPTSPLE